MKINKWKLGREARLPADFLDSEAFRAIKGAKTMRVLIRFYQKRRWITDRKRKGREYIHEPHAFTYAEAEALGIGRSRFHESIRELYRLGFIDVEHQGGGLARDYSRYSISARWRDYGTDKFKSKEKPRTVRPGRDVNTLKRRKAQTDKDAGREKQVTLERDCQLRRTVTIGAEAAKQGSAVP